MIMIKQALMQLIFFFFVAYYTKFLETVRCNHTHVNYDFKIKQIYALH